MMRIDGFAKYIGMALIAGGILTGFFANVALAETSKSSSYKIEQMQLGGSSDLNACSDGGQYCADTSVGGVTSGDGTGTVDTKLDDSSGEPALDMTVVADSTSLGTLTTESTATKTMQISIRNYLSNGYVLQIVGEAPHYGDHTLTPLSQPTASQMGVEQFGINVVKNTTPNFGADPVQVPSSDISFGVVADDYKTPNMFMYADGDVIALSHSSTGQTDYTVSMIVNIGGSTPAGQYSGDFSAVVVPIY